jgi:hypothetical protein
MRELDIAVADMVDVLQWRKEQGPWIPACGGKEKPMTVNGVRILYCWQPTTGKHAYVNLDTDVIMSQDDVDALMRRYG